MINHMRSLRGCKQVAALLVRIEQLFTVNLEMAISDMKTILEPIAFEIMQKVVIETEC